PNFEVTRHLGKRCDVWLDSGGREPEEVMDGYMLDVERVVAGSKTLASLDSFSVLYALSSEALPCLDWDGRVVWRGPGEKQGDLRGVDLLFPRLLPYHAATPVAAPEGA